MPSSTYVPLIAPADVPGLVAKAPIVVLRVDYGTPLFDDSIRSFFQTKYAGQVSFGRVSRGAVNLRDFLVAAWVQQWNRDLGLEPADVLRDGYYLFVGGRICGHHSALWQWDKDKVPLVVGFVGALAGALLQSPEISRQAWETTKIGAAQRVTSYFEKQIQDARARRSEESTRRRAERVRRDQRRIEAQEAARAYRVLGLQPSCSDAELRSRIRELAKRQHPDVQHSKDQAEVKRAHEAFVQINAAIEVVKRDRGRRPA